MKITREINGQMVEIELTKGEIHDAYKVQEREYQFSDCENEFEIVYGDEEWFGTIFNNEAAMESILELIVENYNTNMYEYGMSDLKAREDAVVDEDVVELIEHYREELCSERR